VKVSEDIPGLRYSISGTPIRCGRERRVWRHIIKRKKQTEGQVKVVVAYKGGAGEVCQKHAAKQKGGGGPMGITRTGWNEGQLEKKRVGGKGGKKRKKYGKDWGWKNQTEKRYTSCTKGNRSVTSGSHQEGKKKTHRRQGLPGGTGNGVGR